MLLTFIVALVTLLTTAAGAAIAALQLAGKGVSTGRRVSIGIGAAIVICIISYIGAYALFLSYASQQPSLQSSSTVIQTVVVTATTQPTPAIPAFLPIESGTTIIYDKNGIKNNEPLNHSTSSLTLIRASEITTYGLSYSMTNEEKSIVTLAFSFEPKVKNISEYKTLDLTIHAPYDLFGVIVCMQDRLTVVKCIDLGYIDSPDKAKTTKYNVTVTRSDKLYQVQIELGAIDIDKEQIVGAWINVKGTGQSGNGLISFGNIGFFK